MSVRSSVAGKLLEEGALGPPVTLAERMDRVDLAQIVGRPCDEWLPVQVTQEVLAAQGADDIDPRRLYVLGQAEQASLGNGDGPDLPGPVIRIAAWIPRPLGRGGNAGIANSAFFLVLFLSARLYADSGLQVIYIALGFAGWWQWLHGGRDRSRLTVARSSPWLLARCAAFVLAATWGLTVLLRAAHDIAPFWDALTTAISLAAQFLLNAKKIENWAFWIAADLVYVPLYMVKRLDLTALVYLLFLGLCSAGVTAWRRAL